MGYTWVHYFQTHPNEDGGWFWCSAGVVSSHAHCYGTTALRSVCARFLPGEWSHAGSRWGLSDRMKPCFDCKFRGTYMYIYIFYIVYNVLEIGYFDFYNFLYIVFLFGYSDSGFILHPKPPKSDPQKKNSDVATRAVALHLTGPSSTPDGAERWDQRVLGPQIDISDGSKLIVYKNWMWKPIYTDLLFWISFYWVILISMSFWWIASANCWSCPFFFLVKRNSWPPEVPSNWGHIPNNVGKTMP